jgi:hypothetical protein
MDRHVCNAQQMLELVQDEFSSKQRTGGSSRERVAIAERCLIGLTGVFHILVPKGLEPIMRTLCSSRT